MESRSCSYSIEMLFGIETKCVAQYDDASFDLLPKCLSAENKKALIEHIVKHYLHSIQFSHDAHHYPLRISKIVGLNDGGYIATLSVGDSIHNGVIPYQIQMSEFEKNKCAFDHVRNVDTLNSRTKPQLIEFEQRLHADLIQRRDKFNEKLKSDFLSGSRTIEAPRPSNPLHDDTLDRYASIINKEIYESQEKLLGEIHVLKQACDNSKTKLTVTLSQKKEEFKTLAENDEILLAMLMKEHSQLEVDFAILNKSTVNRQQQLDEFTSYITHAHKETLTYSDDLHQAKFLLAWTLYYAASTYFADIQKKDEDRKSGLEQLNRTFASIAHAQDNGEFSDLGDVYKLFANMTLEELEETTNQIIQTAKTSGYEDGKVQQATNSITSTFKSLLGRANKRETALRDAFKLANQNLASPYFTLNDDQLTWSEDISTRENALNDKIAIKDTEKKLAALRKDEDSNQSTREQELNAALEHFENRVRLCITIRQLQLNTKTMINETSPYCIKTINDLIKELPIEEFQLWSEANSRSKELNAKQKELAASIEGLFKKISEVTALEPDPIKKQGEEEDLEVVRAPKKYGPEKSPRKARRSPAEIQLKQLENKKEKIKGHLNEINSIHQELAALEQQLAKTNTRHNLEKLDILETCKEKIREELKQALILDNIDESDEATQYRTSHSKLHSALAPQTLPDFKNRQAIENAIQTLSSLYQEYKDNTKALKCKRQDEAKQQPTQTTSLTSTRGRSSSEPNSRPKSRSSSTEGIFITLADNGQSPSRRSTSPITPRASQPKPKINDDKPSSFWDRSWREIAIATFTGAVTGLVTGAAVGSAITGVTGGFGVIALPVCAAVGLVAGALIGFVASTVVCVLTDKASAKNKTEAMVDEIIENTIRRQQTTSRPVPRNSSSSNLWATPPTSRQLQITSQEDTQTSYTAYNQSI